MESEFAPNASTIDKMKLGIAFIEGQAFAKGGGSGCRDNP